MMESPTWELQEDLRLAREEKAALGVKYAAQVAALKKQFVDELETAMSALRARRPADPYYMIGGQTHPTIAVSFALEELIALVDKYEEKPHRAFFGADGNFIAWYSAAKERDLKQMQVEHFIVNLSDRIVKENGFPKPLIDLEGDDFSQVSK